MDDLTVEQKQVLMDKLFATHEYVKPRDWRKRPELGESEDEDGKPPSPPSHPALNHAPPITRR